VQSVELADDRPARPPGSRKLKKTALAGAGLMLVWLCWQYGWDAFPQFAPRLTDAQGYVGKLSAWPKTAHFQVQSTNRLFRVKLPEGVDVQAADARGRFKGKFEAATHSNLGSDVLFLPSGAGELAVDSPRAFSPLQLLTPLVVGHNTTPTLLTTQYQVVECDLTWSESAHAWTGEIGGHLSSGAPKEDEYVNLYSDLAEASLFSGTNAFSAGQFANDVLHFQAGGSNSFDLRLPTNGFARWLTLPAGNGADEEAQKFAVGQDGTWKIAVSLIQTNAPARPTAANRPARNEISSNSNYQDAAEPPRPGVPQATFKQDLDKGLDKVRGMAERGFTHPLTGQDVRSISLFVGVARWQLSANEAFEKGREFLDLGETNAALTWFSQAVQLSPGEADNQNSLAWQLFLAGRLEEALGHAKEAVRIKPQDASYWDTLAHAEQGLHQWGEAVHAWDQLVKLNPGYFATHTTGVCARDEELYAEARRNAALAPAPRPAPLPGK